MNQTMQQQLITLTETCQIILSASPKWLKDAVSRKLERRWSHARSKYMSETGEKPASLVKDSVDAYEVYKVRTALPLDVAFDNVSQWVPWAVDQVKKELVESITYFEKDVVKITPEAIAIGKNAPEEYIH